MTDRVTIPGDEIAALEQRIVALEAEKRELAAQLAVQAERANAAIAAANDRVYWLDRWHVDLNRVMQRRSASRFRALVRIAMAIVQRLRRIAGAVTR